MISVDGQVIHEEMKTNREDISVLFRDFLSIPFEDIFDRDCERSDTTPVLAVLNRG
jgi:hypothetical protein